MTHVKICGLTNLEDALVAVEAGADLLGFIFYEPSPRYVTPEVVREIVSSIKRQRAAKRGARSGERGAGADDGATQQATGTMQYALPQFVGVFVNAPLETVSRILDDCRLDAAQLHGQESPEFVNYFAGRAFKALRPQSQAEAERLIQKYRPAVSPPGFTAAPLPGLLLDAYHPQLYGGTGHVTDWSMAANIARRYPIMLAGSLTPANVAQAIQAVQPWGVDVSSGVEAKKGRKDHEKVREFVRAVRDVERAA